MNTKTLFITGGHGDIGKAICAIFSNHGYEIIKPTHTELDLNSTHIDEYFRKHKIDPDVIIHCAGLNYLATFDNCYAGDRDKIMQINVCSFYDVLQHLTENLKTKGNGHILAISSLYGTFARKGRLHYVMSKHALNGLIKTLALELGEYNIKVNSLSPGFVDTKMTRVNNNAETISEFKKHIPLQRLATPEEIARVAYFLCSDENTYISGQDIIVDGGYSVGGFQ